MVKIARYSIKEHGKKVHNMLMRYIVPAYLKRLGLENESNQIVAKYSKYESVLDPMGAYEPKFEDTSLVVLNDKEEVKGTMLSYFVKTTELEESIQLFKDFVATNKASDGDSTRGDQIGCGILNSPSMHNNALTNYIAHRCEMETSIHSIAKLFEVDRLLYIESTIVDPELRHRGIAETLSVETAHLGKEELVISEGMVKKEIWDSAGYANDGYLGFTTLEVQISYDGLYCPILFTEPGVVPHGFGESTLFK